MREPPVARHLRMSEEAEAARVAGEAQEPHAQNVGVGAGAGAALHTEALHRAALHTEVGAAGPAAQEPVPGEGSLGSGAAGAGPAATSAPWGVGAAAAAEEEGAWGFSPEGLDGPDAWDAFLESLLRGRSPPRVPALTRAAQSCTGRRVKEARPPAEVARSAHGRSPTRSHDFVDPDGPIPVRGAQALLPTINALMAGGAWGTVVGSKDWHPPDHISFASSHPGRQVGETVRVYVGRESLAVQLFPQHCVAGTVGAEFAGESAFAPALPRASLAPAQHLRRIFHKGQNPDIESFSAFYDMGHHSTGLAEYLREGGTSLVYVCGVATEFCVQATVLDALREGFAVGVVVDAVAAANQQASGLQATCSCCWCVGGGWAGREALLDMEHAGAALLQSSQLVPVQLLRGLQKQMEAAEQQWLEGWNAAEL
eukprot:scaffold17.g591.t1